MARRYKVPAIPAVSVDSASTDVRRALDMIRSFFNQMAKEELVTLSDLVGAGLLNDDKTPLNIPKDSDVPPRITGLVVTGLFAKIMLEWNPVEYSKLGYVEIARSETDDIATAKVIGTSHDSGYIDLPPNSSLSKTYYYWVRTVSKAGVAGPWNDIKGTPGKTANDPAYVLELLAGEIKKTQLHAALVEELDGYGIDIAQIASSLYAQYTLRVGAGGKVAGFGLAADATTSLFEILADRFAIANLSGTGTKFPFIVDSVFGVVMDTALIKDGTITNAKIGLAAVDSAKIADASVGTLKIQGNAVTIPVGSTGATNIPLVYNTWVTVGQVTATFDIAPQAIIFNCLAMFYGASGTQAQVQLAIWIDSTYDGVVGMVNGNGYTPISYTYHAPVNWTGTKTVYLKAYLQSNVAVSSYGYTISCVGAKR